MDQQYSTFNTLQHYGVQGMKWGVWNEETRARRLGRGAVGMAKMVGQAYITTFKVGAALTATLLMVGGSMTIKAARAGIRAGKKIVQRLLKSVGNAIAGSNE